MTIPRSTGVTFGEGCLGAAPTEKSHFLVSGSGQSSGKVIDGTSNCRRAESIIDVNDRHAGGAAIQHSQ